MLIDNLQQATSDPERDYHLASRLDRTISLIRDNPEGAVDRIADEIAEADAAGNDHSVFSALENLGEWYVQKSIIRDSSKRDFSLLVTALSELDEVFEDARMKGSVDHIGLE